MTTPHTYFYSIGRRKTATAQVRLFSGKGESTINGLPVDKYINRADLFQVIYSPLKVAWLYDAFHFSIIVEWSWISAQAGAIRLGISRALVESDINLRKALKWIGFLSRDARQVERKKPGLHKARKSPSWSKR